MTILHIANWYPNPWDNIEGNFIRDQIAVFRQELPGEVVVVQVRPAARSRPRLSRPLMEEGARGYILHAPVRPGSKSLEWLSTVLLVMVLLRERAWRFEALHFHIAYPLLMYTWIWRWIFRRPIIISEHWSAYHYNFYLSDDARGLRNLRRPFQQCYPVLAVSSALLADIRNFAQRDDFRGFVVPNIVPQHEASKSTRNVPVLFTVNRWNAIKNPRVMLEGLHRAAEAGLEFDLVIGGFGVLIEEMTDFVQKSALRGRTQIIGKMSKAEIAAQLAVSDGYLFSSNYETFSIACAEALSAGVPLIGPPIPAISEYAGPQDWVMVASRNPEDWKIAVTRFWEIWEYDGWDRSGIAQRAKAQFSPSRLRAGYRDAMYAIGLGDAPTIPENSQE